VLADQLGLGDGALDASEKPTLSINKPAHKSGAKRGRHANHSGKPSRGSPHKTGRR
jgi:hypothetical protein